MGSGLAVVLAGWIGVAPSAGPPGFDRDLLEDRVSGGRVAVVPAWQGRVMTSTTGGPFAPSFGWLNEELIRSGERRPHINAFGAQSWREAARTFLRA